MKKLLIGLFVLFVVISCKQKQENTATTDAAKAQPAASIIFKTLNGVDAIQAVSMIQNFKDLTASDTKPNIQSYWIPAAMLHNIVLLLDAEKQQAISDGRTDITDGIRIYFGSDPSSTTTTHPLKTSIVIAATKDNGASGNDPRSCPSRRRHLDYYDHSANSVLYKLAAFEAPCSYTIGSSQCPGATLYSCPACASLPSCSSTPHDIPVAVALQMVANFHDHAINTYGEWFDLSLLETIDNETRHNGIRIYFATNPASSNPYTSNRDAFIITTTEDPNNTGTNSDYYDCKTAQAYNKLYQKQYPKATVRLPPQDKGELCPDNCN